MNPRHLAPKASALPTALHPDGYSDVVAVVVKHVVGGVFLMVFGFFVMDGNAGVSTVPGVFVFAWDGKTYELPKQARYQLRYTPVSCGIEYIIFSRQSQGARKKTGKGVHAAKTGECARIFRRVPVRHCGRGPHSLCYRRNSPAMRCMIRRKKLSIFARKEVVARLVCEEFASSFSQVFSHEIMPLG